MRALIAILAVIAYIVILANYADVNLGSVPAFFFAAAYIFVPIGILTIVGMVAQPDPADQPVKKASKADRATMVKVVLTAVLTVGVSAFGVMLINHALKPSHTTDVAREEAKEATWVTMGKNAVRQKLKDASSAKFADVFFHRGEGNTPVTCGKVNAKNSFGGYSGFQHFVSAGSSDLTFLEGQAQKGEFAKVWNRYCAN